MKTAEKQTQTPPTFDRQQERAASKSNKTRVIPLLDLHLTVYLDVMVTRSVCCLQPRLLIFSAVFYPQSRLLRHKTLIAVKVRQATLQLDEAHIHKTMT